MDFEEVLDIINNLEMKYSVDQWKYKGMHAWPIIRMEIIRFLLKKDKLSPKKTHKRNWRFFINLVRTKIILLRRFLRIIPTFLAIVYQKLLSRNLHHESAEIVFFSNHDTIIKLRGHFYNRLIDPLIQYCDRHNFSWVSFELRTHTKGVKIPRKYPAEILDMPIRKIRKDLTSYIHNNGIKRLENDLTYTEELVLLSHELMESLELRISALDVLEEVYRIYSFFKEKLEKINPKIAIMSNYPTTVGFGFLHACNELGIKSFELQHGVQGENHVSYSRWNKIPKDGFSNLPDVFLVWTVYEKESIERWVKKKNGLIKHLPVVIGNVFLNEWKTNSSLVEHYDHIFEKLKVKQGYKSTILYTISNKIPPQYIFQYIKSRPDILFLMRLHPQRMHMKKSIIKILKKWKLSNVEIDSVNKVPLYAALRNVDFHITRFSSVVLEALEFNIKSIVLDEWGRQLYTKYIDNQTIYYANNYDSLKTTLSVLLSQKTDNVNSFKKEELNYETIFSHIV